ncbi:MAG TPA: ABC transporter permease [Candidatus Saccharimonadales bacterium]|nr:ABC transporter permease [Candidatus Saccharimonadales bacterium]
MFATNLKLAIQSVKTKRWRSFLTMLGVVIGVVSVVMTVSIGYGIKKQITSQINQLGPNLITILPEQNTSSTLSLAQRLNFVPAIGSGSFSERDLTLVGATNGVGIAVPMASVTGDIQVGNKTYSGDSIISTTDALPEVLNQTVAYGQFFSASDNAQNFAVIGANLAQALFHEPVPIGNSFQMRGVNFVVAGIFAPFDVSQFSSGTDYNNSVFIPFAVGNSLSGNQPDIYQILAKPSNPKLTDQVTRAISNTLEQERGGQTDFTVLEQKQILALSNRALTLLTTMIASVAGISLVVGGIGIMNIMLVSVMERTREIGIRKAIGATNKHIMNQFLIEASIISLSGGIIGVLISLAADYAISQFTNLPPSLSLEIVAIAIGVSLLEGIVFGAMPAIRAAKRDPIDSLRHE